LGQPGNPGRGQSERLVTIDSVTRNDFVYPSEETTMKTTTFTPLRTLVVGS
jgi:hypothetical protein